tara:strand:+ start:17 stop:217 length:201 start_codon:yes stop_codon:yes gene_type:complete
LIKKIIFFFIFLFLISFGISNQEIISLSIWPIKYKLYLPAYLMFYLALIVGVLLASCYYLVKKKDD